MQQLTHIDCFSGAGGFCAGLRAGGFKTLLAIEKVPSCAETYHENHANVPIICKDIRQVSSHEIEFYVKNEIDLVTAGMPCETFSTAGSKSRSFYDHRQYLFEEAIRIANIVDSKLILFENVPGITTKRIGKEDPRLIIDEIYDALSIAGYKYSISSILNAADFGVPQYRERFFILASKEKCDLHPPISHHNGSIPIKDAFIDLPVVEANGVEINTYLDIDSQYSLLMKDHIFWGLSKSKAHLTYHIPPKHRFNTIERFKLIEPGEGLKDLFFKYDPDMVQNLIENNILPKKWYIQRNRRAIENQPSVTITSHCIDEIIHPRLNRALTIREVARLQSFPDYYDFKGGPIICPHIYETQDKYEQIGDAVPPLLALAWANAIKSILSK